MALSMDVTLDYGITIENAYIRVDKTEGGKNGLIAMVNMYNIVGQEKKLVGRLSPTDSTGDFYFVPSVSTDSNNFIKQAYLYLKTLDQFSTATDC